MKLFVDFHQRSLFKETAKHVKCAIGHFIGRFDPRGFRHKELFVVRKFDFDSNVNIAVVRIVMKVCVKMLVVGYIKGRISNSTNYIKQVKNCIYLGINCDIC